jgi:hypothetical protein
MRVQAGNLSLPNNSAIAPYLRVKMSGGYLVAAGETDNEIGTLEQRVLATDTVGSVVPKNVEGSIKMVASEAITAFTSVYGAASGKAGDTANANFLGMALTAASGDGAIFEMIRQVAADELDNLGSVLGNLTVDDDFLGDWPASGTALSGEGAYAWTKTETNGLGVVSEDVPNGSLTFEFDAVAEAATATLYMAKSPVDVDDAPVFECRFAVFDIGDDAALDIDIGLAADSHATDFEATNNYAAFHLNGASLLLKAHSDDGATDVAETTTGVTLTDDTYVTVKIDCTDKSDVKFYVDEEGGDGYVRVASGTTFDLSNYAGGLTPIVMMEKTSNDTTAEIRVDRIRVQSQRN